MANLRAIMIDILEDLSILKKRTLHLNGVVPNQSLYLIRQHGRKYIARRYLWQTQESRAPRLRLAEIEDGVMILFADMDTSIITTWN